MHCNPQTTSLTASSQAASEPAYADIVSALLFSREGQEVYLRPPASFNIPLGQPISFAEVQELARGTRQTALGYISTDRSTRGAAGKDGGGGSSGSSSGSGSGGTAGSSGGGNGGGHDDAGGSVGVGRSLPVVHSVIQKLSRAARVHLGLSGADQVVLKEGDMIVVLAEDF